MTAPDSLPHIGELPAGPRNAISDVAGVTVGHHTLAVDAVQTGVTVVRPHQGDLFLDRVPAAAVVLNGFGKSVGLVQVQELGVLETPVALTNTFSVAAVATAQIRECIAANPQTGRSLPTVNPLVFECNDGYLNDIQQMAVCEEHYLQALASASTDFEQGSVGAGRGMSCFGLKGGIGSASRIARIGGTQYTVGAMVLSNFGKLEQLTLAGQPLGRQLQADLVKAQVQGQDQDHLQAQAQAQAQAQGQGQGQSQSHAQPQEPEKGSIILLIATDAPLDARQLRRLALRAGVGLARTGSVFGHGSGDIALAFSTAYTVPLQTTRPMPGLAMLHDALLDPLFQAAADSTEQSIIHALLRSSAVTGRNAHSRQALTDLLPNG